MSEYDNDNYNFSITYEQGDEFNDFLKEENGDVVKALRKWGRDFSWRIERCLNLADRIAEHNNNNPDDAIKIEGFDNLIKVHGPQDFLDILCDDGILFKIDIYGDEE